MALSAAQQYANAFGKKVNPQPSFADRFVKDVSDTAKGFVPGLLEIGKTISHDLATPFTGNSLRSDDLVGAMATGFKEQSFIPALLSGKPGEAWDRFSAKPFSGLLDASMVLPANKLVNTVGRNVGTQGTRSAFAARSGYVPLAPTSADALNAALPGLRTSGPSAFDALPATFDLKNGGRVPAREYMQNIQPLRIGDTQWLRRTNRTMLPASTDSFGSDLAQRHRSTLETPEGTLGDDPLRQHVRPRAEDEVIAQLGDKTGDWFDQQFPGFASRRLARKIQRRNMAQGRVSSDVAWGASGRAWEDILPVLQEVAPDLDEAGHKQVLGDAVFAASTGHDPERIMAGISAYDPKTTALPDTPQADWYDLTPEEAGRQHGLYLHRQTEDGGLADLFDHDEAGLTHRELIEKYGQQLPFQYSYRVLSPAQKEALNNLTFNRDVVRTKLDDALNDQDYSAGYVDLMYMGDDGAPKRLTREDLDADPSLVFRALDRRLGAPKGKIENLQMLDESGGLTDLARERIQAARTALGTLQTKRGSRKALSELETPLVQSLLDLYDKSVDDRFPLVERSAFVKRAIDRLEKGEDLTLDDLAPRGYRKKLDPAFSKDRGDMEVYYNQLAAKVRRAFQYGAGRDRIDELVALADGSDDPAALSKVLSKRHGKMYDEVVEAYSAMRDNRAEFDSLSEYTRGQLNTAALLSGRNELVEANAPGAVNRVRSMLDENTPRGRAVRQLLADERFQSYLRYKEAVTNKTGEIAKERLGGNRLPEERIEQNRKRASKWVGRETAENASFHPMRYERRERPEGDEVDAEMGDLRSSVNTTGPGDPFRVFLSGKFDTDPSLHVRNYQLNNDMLTHDRIIDNIRDSGIVLSPDELKNEKRNGTFIKEDDLGKNNARGAAPWVLLKHDGPLISDIKKARPSLESFAYELRAAGKHDAADAMLEYFDELEGVDPTLGRAERSFKASASDKQTKEPIEKLQHHLIPTPMYTALKKEVENSVASINLASDMMKKVGGYWKFSVLHARFPSWFRNNFIGAQIMLAMSGGLSDYASSIGRASGNKELLNQYIPEAAELGSSHIARGISAGKLTEDAGPMKKRFFDTMNWLSDVNQKYADSPARLARTQQVFDDKVKQLQELGRQNGQIIEDTPELREQMLQHGPTRDAIAEEMLRDMVDFSNMGRLEREWITALFPFYSWMKGSTQAALRLQADHPDRVIGAAAVSGIGTRETTADAGAAAPDFARGWYNPFGDTWIKTAGWNPYETPLDLLSMATGAVPGGMSYNQYGTENLLGSAHPILSGGMAAILGRDPFFGTPIANDNPMDTFLSRQLDNPVFDFVTPFMGDQTGPRATTNKTAGMNTINMLGIPLVDPRWGQVHSRGYDEAMERFKIASAIATLNPPAAGISPR